MWALFVTAFLLGIGGSLHCVGMCGPLVMGMPFEHSQRKWDAVAFYAIGKSTAYGIMGAVFGLIGKGIAMMEWQQALSIIAGIFIIAFALIPHLLQSNKINYAFSKPFGNLMKRISAQPKLQYFAGLGFLNGFLPCGLVYTALAGSAVTADPINGFVFMFVFGMGTMPALAAIGLFKHKMGVNFRGAFKKISLVLSLSLGVLLIARGMNLGIPYVSPRVENKEVKGCCTTHKTAPSADTSTISCH